MSRHGPAVVLVPGAWHQARCWDAVGAHLDAHRIPWSSLTLPSTGPGPPADPSTGPSHSRSGGGCRLPGFAADVAAVVAQIESAGREVVLCGHGYGGMVISEAGLHPAVVELVFLAAWCPDPGESVVDLSPWLRPSTRPGRPVRWRSGGRVEVSPRGARRWFYRDLPVHRAAPTVARLQPSSGSILGASTRNPAWLTKPTTFALGRRDGVVGHGVSRHMAKRVLRSQLARGRVGQHAVSLDTGHSPFYSAPAVVAELLAWRR